MALKPNVRAEQRRHRKSRYSGVPEKPQFSRRLLQPLGPFNLFIRKELYNGLSIL